MLNTGFFLWLLSAVLITWLPGHFAAQQAQRATQNRIQRLDLEVAYRLHAFNQRATSDSIEALARHLANFRHGPGLFLEFRETNSEALMVELRELVPPRERPELQRAFRAAVYLPLLVDSTLRKEVATITGIKP